MKITYSIGFMNGNTDATITSVSTTGDGVTIQVQAGVDDTVTIELTKEEVASITPKAK
jgi:hypothetical protein